MPSKPTGRPNGRPSKRNGEVEKKILDSLRAGNYLETAARYAGIHPDTLNEWRKEFPEFSEAVEQARAEGEVRSVAVINRAELVGDWRAAAWHLQHAFPGRWRDQMVVEHEGLGEVFEEIARRAQLAEDEAGGGGG